MVAVTVRLVQQVVGDVVRVPQPVVLEDAPVNDLGQLLELAVTVETVAVTKFFFRDGIGDNEMNVPLKLLDSVKDAVQILAWLLFILLITGNEKLLRFQKITRLIFV